MIDGWDKGPRDRTKSSCEMHESADWVYRLGPQVAVEVHDLNGKRGTGEGELDGVIYSDLVIGEGPDAHRVQLGPVLYGRDKFADVPTVEDALQEEERRGRKAASFMLSKLREAL